MYFFLYDFGMGSVRLTLLKRRDEQYPIWGRLLGHKMVAIDCPQTQVESMPRCPLLINIEPGKSAVRPVLSRQDSRGPISRPLLVAR